MIVNSHYVALQPPFPVIYCNGEVGMQIGTLIVIEGAAPGETQRWGNRYSIRSHSHPVVSYGNKSAGIISAGIQPNDWSEGVVWEHVELRDVTVLCHAPNGVPNDSPTADVPGNGKWVHLSAMKSVQARLPGLVTQERIRDLMAGQQRFSLTSIVRSLARIMPADLPVFNFEPKGSLMLLKGGLRPGEHSITSNHIMGLPFFFIAVKMGDTLDATLEAVKMQVEDYLNAVSARREKVQIEFKCRDEELKPLVERLNADYFQH